MPDLWASDDVGAWRAALAGYPEVVARQGVARLAELDAWFHEELPGLIAGRSPPYVTLEELVRASEWKMARGVWRGRNLVLVRSNDPAIVERVSREALARTPDPTAPIVGLAELAGVGPATASAIASAAAPDVYPFFDELVGGQIPGLGKLDFTQRSYARYAAALRERARQLGGEWTPAAVERALWAHVGGKAGARTALA